MDQENENKVGLLKRVFSEDRVARTKKALSYTLNGVFRVAIPAAGVVASLFIGKMFFENAALDSFRDETPNATASQIYDELGILSRASMNSTCDINTEKLEEAFRDADVVACIEQDFAESEDFNGKLELAPIVFVSVFCLKALPKGAAYFQIAFREAMNSNNRVLKERDLVAMRDQHASSPPPPAA